MFMPIQSLNAFAWTFTSVAIVLTAGRYWIRWWRTKRLGWDDLLNGAALALLIGFVSTWAVYFPTLYAADAYSLGLSDSVPSDDELTSATKVQLANIMLFWATIYAVKASFLATYYHVFSVSGRFRKAWWFVTIFTIISFLATILGVLWACGSPAVFANLVACSEANTQLVTNSQAYWCALNISSDLLVIALPISMLRQIHMRVSQKWGLAAIFAIVTVDILFDCLRTIYTLDAALPNNDNANAIWDLCEPSVAVMVCALPSYRALLSSSEPKSRGQSYKVMHHYPAGMGENSQRSKQRYDITEMETLNERSIRSGI